MRWTWSFTRLCAFTACRINVFRLTAQFFFHWMLSIYRTNINVRANDKEMRAESVGLLVRFIKEPNEDMSMSGKYQITADERKRWFWLFFARYKISNKNYYRKAISHRRWRCEDEFSPVAGVEMSNRSIVKLLNDLVGHHNNMKYEIAEG